MDNHKNNPWQDIDLNDYENHMKLDSVMQLQVLNAMMKGQFDAYPVSSAMILGVAGGNGLEHVSRDKYETIYGVDINEDYLRATAERYRDLSGVLKCIRADLMSDADLPHAELLIADLLIEYIGYDNYAKAVKKVNPGYVSCVIQINTDTDTWVSESPYLHAFDRLDEVHCQMEEDSLTEVLEGLGYRNIFRSCETLPNGKALVRLDYQK
ncbi:hypothetical protein SAMN02910456_02448 [Ruminococcaceae bacterium YRB3002]|nr:hypothetical protein SAMN02910456_02448 [Ruminococcaceae bacterium YRB3002]